MNMQQKIRLFWVIKVVPRPNESNLLSYTITNKADLRLAKIYGQTREIYPWVERELSGTKFYI